MRRGLRERLRVREPLGVREGGAPGEGEAVDVRDEVGEGVRDSEVVEVEVALGECVREAVAVGDTDAGGIQEMCCISWYSDDGLLSI